METIIYFSSNFHLQTDGLLEQTIQILKDMLQACILDFIGSWNEHLSLVEYAYCNNYQGSI